MEKLLKLKQFACKLPLLLGSTLLISFSAAQANTSNPIFDGPANSKNYCMADAYYATGGKGLKNTVGESLNCTANDVEITTVTVKAVNGTPPDPSTGDFTCTNGSEIVVTADLRVRTNANERWDTTFYLPLNQKSPQVVQQDSEACSIVIPKNEFATDIPSGILVAQDLDDDFCGDIAKGPLVNDEYTLVDATFTMLCDGGDDQQVDFVYCAGWDNQERDNCSADEPYPGQEPNTTSKCNCGDIPLNIFIQPDPPVPTKTLTSVSTYEEPGGEFEYTYSFTNDSTQSSIFIHALTDYIDLSADGSFEAAYALDLWGPIYTFPAGDLLEDSLPADGVYLTASTCNKNNGASIEVLPEDTFSCTFKVFIVDRDLPDDQSPEIYGDVVQATLKDVNGDSVGNPTSCETVQYDPNGQAFATTGLLDASTPSNNDDKVCSNPEEVNITNDLPTITVTKNAVSIDAITGVETDVTEIVEPGEDVTYKITVENTSGFHDSPLALTSITDPKFPNINGATECNTTNVTIAFGDTYTCYFTRYVAVDAGSDTSFDNTVTATADDNELTEATDTGMESLNVVDVETNITLVKTAGTAANNVAFEVDETGDTNQTRDVEYTYRFSVDIDAVDDVEFRTLDDLVDYDSVSETGTAVPLTSLCNISADSNNANIMPEIALYDSNADEGYTLSPGEWAECKITLPVSGNAGDSWLNKATVTGVDSDGASVSAMDPAEVVFTNLGLQITPNFAFKLNVYVTLSNGGVDNVDITGITIGDLALADGVTLTDTFIVRDESTSYGYDYPNESNLPFCAVDTANPDILVGETYKCGFTLELLPGFANPTDVAGVMATLSGTGGLVFTVNDGDTADTSVIVGITVETAEP
ncbi:hypothetical protein E2K93_03370 [Thalassotalea sp. HSM 43]|uniref:hypothetical protein n=1 Tax=Thalassotalea sp. HSM 43 TaxID=2552945 RepID=UPI00107FD784|nr:hypothetical protein [Thalassotalea sp. HSM 43]QBY03472.1 hypothetical protein E2K93_03370 [Thalassotalea sp. HSM 43]